MRRPVPIEWLAGGLASNITGVERVALALAGSLITSGIASPSDFLVCVANGSELESEFERMGVPCIGEGRSRGHRGSPRIVHNFGRELRVRRPGETYIFTVHDWGPFHDREMSPKARIAWSSSIILGHLRASDVHYVNARLPATKPAIVPSARQSLVCPPDSLPVPGRIVLEEPRFALFVGTAAKRKRLDLVSKISASVQWPVVLVGDGTELFGGENVVGRGRVTEAELEQCYREAACVLLLSEYEGFGIPILEGARRGVHSVVSPEVLTTLPHELHGFCHPVAEMSPSALADAVAKATARRGHERFEGTLLQPLLSLYEERLAR
jgi:glycosyltransferase involved in cell wall biosynthesis